MSTVVMSEQSENVVTNPYSEAYKASIAQTQADLASAASSGYEYVRGELVPSSASSSELARRATEAAKLATQHAQESAILSEAPTGALSSRELSKAMQSYQIASPMDSKIIAGESSPLAKPVLPAITSPLTPAYQASMAATQAQISAAKASGYTYSQGKLVPTGSEQYTSFAQELIQLDRQNKSTSLNISSGAVDEQTAPLSYEHYLKVNNGNELAAYQDWYDHIRDWAYGVADKLIEDPQAKDVDEVMRQAGYGELVSSEFKSKIADMYERELVVRQAENLIAEGFPEGLTDAQARILAEYNFEKGLNEGTYSRGSQLVQTGKKDWTVMSANEYKQYQEIQPYLIADKSGGYFIDTARAVANGVSIGTLYNYGVERDTYNAYRQLARVGALDKYGGVYLETALANGVTMFQLNKLGFSNDSIKKAASDAGIGLGIGAGVGILGESPIAKASVSGLGFGINPQSEYSSLSPLQKVQANFMAFSPLLLASGNNILTQSPIGRIGTSTWSGLNKAGEWFNSVYAKPLASAITAPQWSFSREAYENEVNSVKAYQEQHGTSPLAFMGYYASQQASPFIPTMKTDIQTYEQKVPLIERIAVEQAMYAPFYFAGGELLAGRSGMTAVQGARTVASGAGRVTGMSNYINAGKLAWQGAKIGNIPIGNIALNVLKGSGKFALSTGVTSMAVTSIPPFIKGSTMDIPVKSEDLNYPQLDRYVTDYNSDKVRELLNKELGSKGYFVTEFDSSCASGVCGVGATTKITLNPDRVDEFFAEYGQEKALAILAIMGFKPSIAKDFYIELSPESQALFTQGTKYLNPIYDATPAGSYFRGTEALYRPVVEWLNNKPVGFLASGMFQYYVPHTMVTDTYAQKGAWSSTALIPHVGATAVYPFLADAPVWQKALGIGLAAIPFAKAPISRVANWSIGTRFGGRMTQVGLNVVTSSPFKEASWVFGKLKLNEWSPWVGADTLASKMGIKAVPLNLGGLKYSPYISFEDIRVSTGEATATKVAPTTSLYKGLQIRGRGVLGFSEGKVVRGTPKTFGIAPENIYEWLPKSVFETRLFNAYKGKLGETSIGRIVAQTEAGGYDVFGITRRGGTPALLAKYNLGDIPVESMTKAEVDIVFNDITKLNREYIVEFYGSRATQAQLEASTLKVSRGANDLDFTIMGMDETALRNKGIAIVKRLNDYNTSVKGNKTFRMSPNPEHPTLIEVKTGNGAWRNAVDLHGGSGTSGNIPQSAYGYYVREKPVTIVTADGSTIRGMSLVEALKTKATSASYLRKGTIAPEAQRVKDITDEVLQLWDLSKKATNQGNTAMASSYLTKAKAVAEAYKDMTGLTYDQIITGQTGVTQPITFRYSPANQGSPIIPYGSIGSLVQSPVSMLSPVSPSVYGSYSSLPSLSLLSLSKSYGYSPLSQSFYNSLYNYYRSGYSLSPSLYSPSESSSESPSEASISDSIASSSIPSSPSSSSTSGSGGSTPPPVPTPLPLGASPAFGGVGGLGGGRPHSVGRWIGGMPIIAPDPMTGKLIRRVHGKINVKYGDVTQRQGKPKSRILSSRIAGNGDSNLGRMRKKVTAV